MRSAAVAEGYTMPRTELGLRRNFLGLFLWNGPVSSRDRSFGPNRSGPRKKSG